MSLGIYGALSPDYSLAFLPAGRLITSFSGIIGSALLPPYPIFKEYANTFALSPWYLSAEATATLLDLELWGKMGPLRLPFLPSLGLRRIVFRGGLRAAAFESETVAFPASAFLRMESDAALLAGMIAEAHLSIMAEASYAFTTSLPGGGTIHFDYGLGLSY